MAFPTLEEWKTPWEEKGEEIDADKVKAFVYAEKKRAHDLDQELKALKSDRKKDQEKVAEFEAAEAKRRQESESAEERARREADERAKKDQESEKALAEARRENARLKVQVATGLPDAAVNRLVGDDYDSLLKDAESYIEETGFKAAADEDPNPLIRQPGGQRINPGDPNPLADKEDTADSIADVVRQRRQATSIQF